MHERIHTTIPTRFVLLFVLLVGVMCLGMILVTSSRRGGAGGLRGGRIVVMRLPTTAASTGQLSVYQDGHAARAVDLSDPQHPFTTVQLVPAEWQAVDALRAQWCQRTPQFRSLRPDESFYDIDLSCGPGYAKHIQIPTDQLPPELAVLLTSVPPP
jgi:hypothetical protein